MKDEVESFWRVAMVEVEEVSERLTFLEGDDGEKCVTQQSEIEGSIGSAMAVAVLLPS